MSVVPVENTNRLRPAPVMAGLVLRFLNSAPEAEALLLFEDTDIERRRAIAEHRVGLISTGDFLREPEAAGLIQSTDHLPEQAAVRGHNLERQRREGGDATTRTRLRGRLAGRGKSS